MADTICPFALSLPGPSSKLGYGSRPKYIENKAGVTIHTAEYDTDNDAPTLHNALFQVGREASWNYTVTREGFLFEHYPPTAVAWHCGSMLGNESTVGIECEGRAPDPIDGPQFNILWQLVLWLREYFGWADQWVRGTNIWEHKDWSATLCKVFTDGMLCVADLEEETTMALTPEQRREVAEIAAKSVEDLTGLRFVDLEARLDLAALCYAAAGEALQGDWKEYKYFLELAESNAKRKEDGGVWGKWPED